MKLNKFVTGFALAVALGLSAIATSQTAEAAGGNVFDGKNREIVGMWVEVQNGKSGWAKLTNTGLAHSKGWSYDTQGKPYQLHVGIEGSPAQWGETIKSGWVSNQSGNIQVNTVRHWLFGNQIHITPSR